MKLNTIAVSFTRPNDTTPYAANDLIANSTSAGSVVPLRFATPPNSLVNQRAGTGYIVKATCWVAGAAFNTPLRLHLFRSTPSVVADNAQYPLLASQSALRVATIDFPFFMNGGTGSDVSMATVDTIRVAIDALNLDGANSFFGLLTTQGAFTPTANQTFRVELVADAYEF